jgi:hypothetical protein
LRDVDLASLRREASYGLASEDQRHNSRFTRRPGIGGPDRSPPFMPGQLRGQRRYAHLQAPLRSNRDDHAGLGKRRAPGEPPRRSCMSPRSLTSSGPSENPFGLRVPARHMMICSHHLSSGAMTGGPPVDCRQVWPAPNLAADPLSRIDIRAGRLCSPFRTTIGASA